MEIKNISIDHESSNEELKLIRFARFNELEYSRIISAISHDISNPIAILKSNIQLLTSNNENGKKELNNELLYLCNESIDELVRFLENIRLINTAIKFKIIPKFSFFEIKDLLNNPFFSITDMNSNSKRIHIQSNIVLKEFSSDFDFLQRIMLDLLNNALKFSKTDVLLLISSFESNFEIVVHDFGIGIPVDEIDQIFNPFFRGANAKMIPGMGLGLSVVKALTESLRGQIYLCSKINQGTIIRIVIPNELAN